MLKAATLYLVIIISLLMAMISVSLLSVAFYYRLEHLKKARFDRLSSNLESGTSMILSSGYLTDSIDVIKDLYAEKEDSVVLNQIKWGAFELNTVKAFELKDTLRRVFLSARSYRDSSAIYLADEDRPLSVSGNTQITGNGELPKSGLKQSYVDGRAYAGKELIKGKISDSGRSLPSLDEERIARLVKHFNDPTGIDFIPGDSLVNSFFAPLKVYHLTTEQQEISGMKIKGKIMLVSDTTLKLGADLVLEDVLVFAPGIVVSDGFKGSCQLFARDSIVIGKNCDFLYPSFAGVFKRDSSQLQSRVSLGEGSHFAGILLSYEKKRTELQTMVALGKNSLLKGEVYATGYIKLESPLTVYGKVYARTFIMQRSTTLYENYLIDVVFNRHLLSKYYLGSALFKRSETEHEILKWLN